MNPPFAPQEMWDPFAPQEIWDPFAPQEMWDPTVSVVKLGEMGVTGGARSASVICEVDSRKWEWEEVSSFFQSSLSLGPFW